MFNRMFGGKKQETPQSRAPQSNATIDQLDNSIDLLEKRETVLEKKIQLELKKAKEFYAKKNTQGAMQCMKRKKTYEEQMIAIGNQKNNLETLKFTIQQQSMNKEIIQAQMTAKNELKKENKKMNADKIEETMDDLMDEMDKAQQVSAALQQPLDNNFVDEDDLMAELELEMEEDTALDMPEKVETLPEMPKVPKTKLPAPASKKKTKEEEDEEALRMLEAELAI